MAITRKTPKDDVSQARFDPHMKELTLAYSRMNSSPVRRLDWLVRFTTEEDLSALSAGQRSDRKWEFLIFLSEGTKPEKLAQNQDAELLLTLLPSSSHNPFEIDYNSIDGNLILEKFHRDMKNNLPLIFSEPGWVRSIKERIVPLGTFLRDFTGAERALDIAFTLVKTHRERLRQCDNCNKIFVEKRKGRARFCSKKCSTFVKLKKWRAKKKVAKKRMKK